MSKKPLAVSPKDVRTNHYLICGEIIFRGEDVTLPPCSMRLNCVITSKDGRLAVQQIARMQQTLQMQFHKRMEDPTLVVLDCVIGSIMPLGMFTTAEFNKLPEGMTVAEAKNTQDELRQILQPNGPTTAGNA